MKTGGRGHGRGKGEGRKNDEERPPSLRRRPDVRERSVGLDLILYDPATQNVHMLNAVAAAVWRHITPDRSLENIVEALQLSFSIVNPRGLYGDVEQLLDELVEVELLVDADADVPSESNGEAVRFEIPDAEITTLVDGYESPAMKSFTLSELDELIGVSEHAPAPFADTWGPMEPA